MLRLINSELINSIIISVYTANADMLSVCVTIVCAQLLYYIKSVWTIAAINISQNHAKPGQGLCSPIIKFMLEFISWYCKTYMVVLNKTCTPIIHNTA